MNSGYINGFSLNGAARSNWVVRAVAVESELAAGVAALRERRLQRGEAAPEQALQLLVLRAERHVTLQLALLVRAHMVSYREVRLQVIIRLIVHIFVVVTTEVAGEMLPV